MARTILFPSSSFQMLLDPTRSDCVLLLYPLFLGILQCSPLYFSNLSYPLASLNRSNPIPIKSSWFPLFSFHFEELCGLVLWGPSLDMA